MCVMRWAHAGRLSVSVFPGVFEATLAQNTSNPALIQTQIWTMRMSVGGMNLV